MLFIWLDALLFVFFKDLLELGLLVLVEKAFPSFGPVSSRSLPLIIVVVFVLVSVLVIRVVFILFVDFL